MILCYPALNGIGRFSQGKHRQGCRSGSEQSARLLKGSSREESQVPAFFGGRIMSGTEVLRTGVSRRGFIKATALTAGFAALSGTGMATAGDWLQPAEAEAEAEETIAYTYHQGHCGGMCPLQCTVRDGRLAKVEPNQHCEDRYQTICLKGISEIQHIYGQGRIQTPLKRVGDRGSNEFESISWDEALDTIADTIQKLQKESGKGCVLVAGSGEEPNNPFLAAMLGAQTGGFTGIDVGLGGGMDAAIGFGGGYASANAEARDWVNAKTLITVGSNFCESSLAQCRLFFEAKEAGATTITVDPHFSTTAGKSDQWIPIEPGTDAALFLGMIGQIVDNGWCDEEFMLEHTSLPFLVDVETGALLRDHAEDPAAEEPETGETNPFFVWDTATGAKAVYTTAGVKPALEGTFTVDGRTCTTVYSLMLRNQRDYSLSWASEKTGISEDTIRELARRYACDKPATLALGWGGNDKFANADIAGHAAALMCALTGNIGKPGANIGIFVGGSWNGYAASLGAWELPEDMVTADSAVNAFDLRNEKNDVRAVICTGDLFAQHFADMGKTEDWIRTLDFVVSIDAYFTEGAKWADIVLPSCSRFENEEEVGNVKSGYNQLVMQEKVIDPLFESKTDFAIQLELAKRLGVDRYLPKSSREYVETLLATSEDPAIAALTVDKLQKAGAIFPLPGIEEPRMSYADLVFDTTSTRMDVYYDGLVEFGQALPSYEDPNEASKDDPRRATYPLQLANVRTRFHIHSQFNDAKWIQQFGEPCIELNPSEMDSRGLATGDVVEVFNDRGSYRVPVKANPAIRPGCARAWEGATADYTKGGNLQSVTNDYMDKRGYALLAGPVAPFSDTLVEVRKVEA